MLRELPLFIILIFSLLILGGSHAYSQIDSLEERIRYYKNNNEIENQLRTEIALARHLIFFEGEIDQGLESLKKLLPIAESQNRRSVMARIHHIMGFTYAEMMDDFDMGLKNYYRALEYYDKNQDLDHKTTLLLNLADVYYSYGSHKEAIKFLFQGLNLAMTKNDEELIASFHNNLGVNYIKLEEKRSAVTYLNKAATYYKRVGDELSYYQTQVNIINLFSPEKMDEEQRKNAMETYSTAIPIFRKEGDYYSLMASLKNLASYYNELGKYSQALELLRELLEYESQIPDLLIRAEAIKSMATSYKGMGDFRNQADYLGQYVKMYDTLFNVAKTKAIAETRIKYQAEKIESENSILKKDKEIQNAKLENERIIKYGLAAGLGLIIVFAGFVFNRFRNSQKQKKIIENQKMEVDTAYSILESKNNEILDSINYAKRIQSAILPSTDFFFNALPDSFVLYMPKDIVAGDFYWLEPIQDIGLGSNSEKNMGHLIAVADCTGHGVPGAMVSVICNNGLNRAVREYGLKDPGNILDKTREIVVKEFEKSSEDVKDGMDIALVGLEPKSGGEIELSFAGAHNPVWIYKKGSENLIEIKGDKQPIGKFSNSKPFTTHKETLSKGDSFYIFSDGFADQFGGNDTKPTGKKLKTKNFRKLLGSIQELPMEEQKARLFEFFQNWKGEFEQLDDVCVVGVRV